MKLILSFLKSPFAAFWKSFCGCDETYMQWQGAISIGWTGQDEQGTRASEDPVEVWFFRII